MDGGIMAENYNGMAVGIFELDSFAACFVALDAASKAANIRIQNIEGCFPHGDRIPGSRHRTGNVHDRK